MLKKLLTLITLLAIAFAMKASQTDSTQTDSLLAQTTSEKTYSHNSANAHYYLAGSSAIPLKAGSGYYKNSLLLVNSLTYGLSDNVSISSGMELYTAFRSVIKQDIGPLVYTNIKAGFPVGEKLHIGGGVFAGGIISIDEPLAGMVFTGYGMATYGTEKSNLTLTVGGGSIFQAGLRGPAVGLSGMARLSEKFAFVSENWIYRESDDSSPEGKRTTNIIGISGGARIIMNKAALTLGLVGGGFVRGGDPEAYSYPVSQQLVGSFWPMADFTYKF